MQLTFLIKNRRGFTLVEILVVLVIMGIIGMVVIPSFEPMRNFTGLRSSARELASELRYAQQQAVNEGVEHAVYVEQTGGKYKYYLRNAAGAVLEEGEMAQDITAASTQVVSGNKIVTVFTTTGEPGSAAYGTKTIELTNKTGDKLKVDVSPIGRVSIQK